MFVLVFRHISCSRAANGAKIKCMSFAVFGILRLYSKGVTPCFDFGSFVPV